MSAAPFLTMTIADLGLDVSWSFAVCHSCGREIRIRKNGTLRKHVWAPFTTCPGSGAAVRAHEVLG